MGFKARLPRLLALVWRWLGGGAGWRRPPPSGAVQRCDTAWSGLGPRQETEMIVGLGGEVVRFGLPDVGGLGDVPDGVTLLSGAAAEVWVGDRRSVH